MEAADGDDATPLGLSTRLEPAEMNVREPVHGPRAVEVAANDGRIHGDERARTAEVLIKERQQLVVALRQSQREHPGALTVHFEHANPIRPAVGSDFCVTPDMLTAIRA